MMYTLWRFQCSGEYYGRLKRMTAPRAAQHDVRNAAGVLCVDDEARCDAFKTHFEAVLSGAGGSVSAAVRADFARKATNATVAPDAPVPTEADVLAAVAAQKAGRAADQYGLNATLLHAVATPGSAVASILTRLVADVWESGEMPQERCRALLVALYKNKGDPQATTNYRGSSWYSSSGGSSCALCLCPLSYPASRLGCPRISAARVRREGV